MRRFRPSAACAVVAAGVLSSPWQRQLSGWPGIARPAVAGRRGRQQVERTGPRHPGVAGQTTPPEPARCAPTASKALIVSMSETGFWASRHDDSFTATVRVAWST